MAGPVAFVGREGELSRLLGALGGDARLVLVVGDAGVGKTRFAGRGDGPGRGGGDGGGAGGVPAAGGHAAAAAGAAALGELAGLEGGGLLAAALDAAPGYVRGEVGRLLPQLGPGGGPGPDERDGGWQRERLFAGVAELLSAVAGEVRGRGGAGGGGCALGGQRDAGFPDLPGAGRAPGAVRVVVTCRSDEAPLAAQVAEWLALVRGAAGTEEIPLGPLSRAEVAGQAAALAGGPVPPRVVDELYRAGGGKPVFHRAAGGRGAGRRARRGPGCRSRRGCRPGWRSCWRRGRAAARGRPGRCWRAWRSRAVRWTRTCWAR